MCICKIRFLLCICVLCWKDKVMLKTQSDGKLPVIIFFSHICSQTIFCTSAAMTFFFSFFFLRITEQGQGGDHDWWEMRGTLPWWERERGREREKLGKKKSENAFWWWCSSSSSSSSSREVFVFHHLRCSSLLVFLTADTWKDRALVCLFCEVCVHEKGNVIQ